MVDNISNTMPTNLQYHKCILRRCKQKKSHACKYGFPKIPLITSILTKSNPSDVTTQSIHKCRALRRKIQNALDETKYRTMSTIEFYDSLNIEYQVRITCQYKLIGLICLFSL